LTILSTLENEYEILAKLKWVCLKPTKSASSNNPRETSKYPKF
jgi:hypothetical protein